MSFSQYEMSRQEGIPASLYLIQWGDAASSYIAYTDSDVPITHAGITYQPEVIGRARIEASGALDRKALEIDINPNASIVRMYAENPPTQKVGLTIRHGHVDDPAAEYLVVWTGVIKNVNWEKPIASIVGEPLDTLLARPGLRRHYMLGCPHVLYSAATCKADKTRLQRVVTPAALGSNYIDLAAGWNGATEASAYIGGYMEWTDANGNRQIRTVVRFGTSENQLLVGNTRTLTTETSVTVYAGCQRNTADCRDLHDNIVNYGGQPWIPLENPIGYVNRFY